MTTIGTRNTRSRPARATMLAALLFTAAAAPADAQGFVELFAGRSMLNRTPVSLTANEARINGAIIPAELRVDVARVKPTNSNIYGARIGHWFGPHIGVALDASTLDPDIRQQTVTANANLQFDEAVFGEEVVIQPGQSVAVDIPRITIPTTATIAALAMVRLPIAATPARPAGRVAPYAFAGPVWLITDPSLDGNLGLRAGAGVRMPIAGKLALFGEYRFTRVNADAIAGRIGGERQDIRGTTGDIRADLNVRNHSAVGGLSLFF